MVCRFLLLYRIILIRRGERHVQRACTQSGRGTVTSVNRDSVLYCNLTDIQNGILTLHVHVFFLSRSKEFFTVMWNTVEARTFIQKINSNRFF